MSIILFEFVRYIVILDESISLRIIAIGLLQVNSNPFYPSNKVVCWIEFLNMYT